MKRRLRWLGVCSSLCGLVLLLLPQGLSFLPAKRYDLLAWVLLVLPCVWWLIQGCLHAGKEAPRQRGGARIAAIAGRLLLLEVLALVTCIVFLSPLPAWLNTLFLLLLLFTLLSLLLVPFFIAFVTAYGQDRRTFAKRQEQEKRAVEHRGGWVLTSDPQLRHRYLRLPRLLFRIVVELCFLAGAGCVILLSVYGEAWGSGALHEAVRWCGILSLTVSLVGFFPLLFVWIDCSGRSLTQRVCLTDGVLSYQLYNGSMERREQRSFALRRLSKVRVSSRSITLRGEFACTLDRGAPLCRRRTIRLARCFPPEQEQLLLSFLAQRLEEDLHCKREKSALY